MKVIPKSKADQLSIAPFASMISKQLNVDMSNVIIDGC